jgi:hypothetical protein
MKVFSKIFTLEGLREEARIAKESFKENAKRMPYIYPEYLAMEYAKDKMLKAIEEYEQAKRIWEDQLK